MINFSAPRASALVLAVALAATAQSASASDVILSNAGNVGGYTGNVTTPSGTTGITATQIHSTAKIVDTGAIIDLKSFCLEPNVSGITGTYQMMSGVDRFGAVKAQQLANLLYNGQNALAAAVTSGDKKKIGGALALAVWEISGESGTSGYSFNSGNFRSWSSFNGALGLANNYLGNILSGSWTGGKTSQLMVLTSRRYQDQLTYGGFGGGVPEPSTWAMMIIGVGATGFAMRRRRRATLAVA